MGPGFQQNGLGNMIYLYPFYSQAQEKAENDEKKIETPTSCRMFIVVVGQTCGPRLRVHVQMYYLYFLSAYYLYNIINILQQEILYLCFNVLTQSCPIGCIEQHAYVSSKRKISIGVDNSRTCSGIIAFGDVISGVARK